ncbi:MULTISPECIES: dephospho-CoA kinase [Rhizobium/Agrobacterium group]|jgi:dephospho-CoA kinase|uniref:Dephospho-CoA kinase n=1 Tax=Agrobacterium tumefaciens TaxID=358 RepID=A0A1B9TDG1_AGRTU|nr:MULTISPECIES: dephospho-CoA kinase [Rhizobium/Agrobacterium group]EHJ96727.1 dephospho-CoA kinase [Agrobacterium tumefaciens 5A]QDG91800.1 dephospho-CoA kinase [Rhizobium sp. NIBRBAC000502774]NSL20273.1 dephospho-CoA kinase [Agrobacterium tumefaciens]NTB89346.1 dephospho-CoA kinase [Agrobacterium tumefaciens]NTC19224.1 dephospho-CoA kinase [Agrobacterium tumefaciens]
MIVIGLTGSIGMGKTTTAKLFAAEGIPVLDSDAVVHDLYSAEAVPMIEAAFPGTTISGTVDRLELGNILRENPANFSKLEAIVHPLVRERQEAFLRKAREENQNFAVLDIPLLFETGAETRVDKVVVVSCAPEIQRQRVLSRPGMTEEKFEMILARQMPDAEKRRRADFIIDSGNGVEAARDQVREILQRLSAGSGNGEKNA